MAPSHLKSLAIDDGTWSRNDLDFSAVGACLIRFTRLSHLEIRNLAHASFLNALPPLPLHTLVVKSDGPPDLIALRQLLEGPRKLATLQSLHIDEEQPQWRESQASPWAAVEAFARTAKAQGVELAGTMLENVRERKEEETMREERRWRVFGRQTFFISKDEGRRAGRSRMNGRTVVAGGTICAWTRW